MLINQIEAQLRLDNVYNGEYKIIDEYKGVKSKAKINHTKCGCTYEVFVNNLINKKSKCPICFNCGKMTEDIFLLKVKSKDNIKEHYDEYIFGKYKGYDEPIEITHKKCNKIWTTTPHNYLNGNQCVYCQHPSKKKDNKTFIKQMKDTFGEEFVALDEYIDANTPIRIIHNKCGNIKLISPHAMLTKGGCEICGKISIGLKSRKSNEKFIIDLNNKLGKEYIPLEPYVTANTPIRILHKQCGTVFIAKPHKIFNNNKQCPTCNSSAGENIIEKELKLYNYNYIKEFKIPDCKNILPLSFDFAVFLEDKDEPYFLIEFDGKQHFEPVKFFGGEEGFKYRKSCDNIKDNYCKNNNIKLLRIPYWDINNIPKVLKEKIKDFKSDGCSLF